MRTIPLHTTEEDWPTPSLGDASKARSDLNKALELGHDRDEIKAALKEMDGGG